MADRSLYSDISSPMPDGLEFLAQYCDRLTQLFNAAIWPLTSVGGTANAVTATLTPPLLVGLVEHMRVAITWAATNTDIMTLSIAGGPDVPILDASGAAMAPGVAQSGSRAYLEYLGSAWIVVNQFSSAVVALPQRQILTASGTWIKPAGLSDDRLVLIRAWGGGGSGARGGTYCGGGGGGAYVELPVRAGELPSSVSYTIAAGGAARTSNSAGADGGASTFGSFITAYGGAGGLRGASEAASAGGGGGGELSPGSGSSGGDLGGGAGASGTGANNAAKTPWGGGGGGGGSTGGGGVGGHAIRGGAGGGGARASGSAGGTSLQGGNGGAGGGDVSPAAGAGQAPAGGGGGAIFGPSGAGARGQIEIWVI